MKTLESSAVEQERRHKKLSSGTSKKSWASHPSPDLSLMLASLKWPLDWRSSRQNRKIQICSCLKRKVSMKSSQLLVSIRSLACQTGAPGSTPLTPSVRMQAAAFWRTCHRKTHPLISQTTSSRTTSWASILHRSRYRKRYLTSKTSLYRKSLRGVGVLLINAEGHNITYKKALASMWTKLIRNYRTPIVKRSDLN